MKAARRPVRKFYGVSSDKIPLGTPEVMLDALEAVSVNEHCPYRDRIEELMAREYYDPDGRDEANHLRETRGGLALEEISRAAGFELGFEFAEWLHAGGKTKEAKK